MNPIDVSTDFYLNLGENRQVNISNELCWFQLQLTGQQAKIIIGKNGCQISFFRKCGAQLLVNSNNRLIITGTHLQVLRAKSLIYSKLNSGFINIPTEKVYPISLSQIDNIKYTMGVNIEFYRNIPDTTIVIIAARKNSNIKEARKLLIQQAKLICRSAEPTND